MAKQSPNDDFFQETTMSFGQHLEELRVALFRSLAALIVFFIIGLFVAKYAIGLMKGPLEKALENYYLTSNIAKLTTEFGKGEELDEGLTTFMTKNRVVSEEIFFERSILELWRERTDTPSLPLLPDTTEDGQEIETKLFPKINEQTLPDPDARLYKFRMWREVKSKIKALNAQEAFLIWLKGAFVVGALLASPFIFFFIWEFVAAGLYPHEKNFVYIFLPFSLLLFLAGASLAFFFVFKPVLAFLFSFNRAMGIEPDPRISEWIGFVLFLPLGFGIAFQLPLVMLFLNRIGVFAVKVYLQKWRIAVLVIFVISMVLTPADPISMLLMAVPLTVLYFLGVALCHFMPKNRSPFTEAYEP